MKCPCHQYALIGYHRNIKGPACGICDTPPRKEYCALEHGTGSHSRFTFDLNSKLLSFYYSSVTFRKVRYNLYSYLIFYDDNKERQKVARNGCQGENASETVDFCLS